MPRVAAVAVVDSFASAASSLSCSPNVGMSSQLGLPGHVVVGEAGLQQVQHDRHGRRGTGRGAEEPGDRAVARGDDLGAELQDAALLRVLLHDLRALTRIDERPVLVLRRRHERAQTVDLLAVVLHELTDEVRDQVGVREGDAQHRPQVVRAHLRDDVEHRTVLEELGAERREGPEHQRGLAVDHARVEVRHRHGRCTDGRLRVDLRLVLLDDLRVAGLQELSADREDSVALDLGDARVLQQLERPSTGADEHELRLDLVRGAADRRAVLDEPGAVLLALERAHLVVRAQRDARIGEVVEELVGEGSEVDVGAGGHARRGEGLTLAALLHEQRRHWLMTRESSLYSMPSNRGCFLSTS